MAWDCYTTAVVSVATVDSALPLCTDLAGVIRCLCHSLVKCGWIGAGCATGGQL